MQIDIYQIPEEGKEISYHENPSAIHLSPDLDIEGGLDIHVTLYRMGKTIAARGEIKTTPLLECGRCSKRFLLPLEIEFDQIYIPKNPVRPAVHRTRDEKGAQDSYKKKSGKAGINAEEEEAENILENENEYEGTAISLDEMIREQVLLEVPMRPLCSSSCRGLCPACGTDLNVKSCDCVLEENSDRPMNPMEKFFVKELKGKKGE